MTYSTRVILAFVGALLLMGGFGYLILEIARGNYEGHQAEALLASGAGLGMLAAAFVRPD